LEDSIFRLRVKIPTLSNIPNNSLSIPKPKLHYEYNFSQLLLLKIMFKRRTASLTDQYLLSFPVGSIILQTIAAECLARKQVGLHAERDKKNWSDKIMTCNYGVP
jgi:hypothetical protein